MVKEKMKDDARFKQCNKEFMYTFTFFVFNILLVFGLTFPLGYNVDASEIKLVLGFPQWYFYGVIVSFILLSISTFLMVRFLFKEMSLEGYEDAEGLNDEI
ncbi:Uncharacterized membrane protein YhdT [Lentibacillus persicus]|uniref:Uncharacterized membrane protein YhdT n=1 Tax=Lentibacillus persicus TaxID=640948 RepID=A0A1I1VZH2_9BACI|nr:YhdT family protein [Lentibacillus persicus]SFD88367.1 Uncharacterized membrane protein YhdT [Lentibacillus persicus]